MATEEIEEAFAFLLIATRWLSAPWGSVGDCPTSQVKYDSWYVKYTEKMAHFAE